MTLIDNQAAAGPEDVPAAPAPRMNGKRFHIRSKKMLVGLILLGIFVLIAVIGPIIAPYKPTALMPLQGPPLHGGTAPSQLPGAKHWLGQTNIGGDILSQMLAGTRPTIIVSFLAGAVATTLAVIIGITAGFIGGIVDEVLSLIANVFLVIPALPLLIAIGAFLGPNRAGNPLVIGLIIAGTGLGVGRSRHARPGACRCGIESSSRPRASAERRRGASCWPRSCRT